MKNTLVVQFDHPTLVKRPTSLRELSEFYCDIWRYDQNFQEYKMCPECQKYFGYQEVEDMGINTCNNNHPPAQLVEAWEPHKVEEEILQQSQEEGFFGCLAINPGTKAIIGFAWARLIDIDEVRETWGDEIVNQLSEETSHSRVVYFNELAVSAKRRREGIGKELVHFVCSWMCEKHPNHMGLLRTHRDSPARIIYERIGYQIFSEDTQHGDGRVMMWVNPIKSLNLAIL